MIFSYQRVLVLGNGGAGKSTFARRMGERFSLPVVHLDKLWWLPGWQNRSREQFDALLAEELSKTAWVMDGNYERTLPVRLAAADAAVFLDIPARTCLEGAYARVEAYAGRTRPDMTEGCPERMDEEFEGWILSYEREVRPRILTALGESGKPCFVFGSRAAADGWLSGFENRGGGRLFS